MDRRQFLERLGYAVLAAGVGAAAVGTGAATATALGPHARSVTAASRAFGSPRAYPRPLPPPAPVPTFFTDPHLTKIKLPGGSLFGLPGSGNLVALTVDDGASSEVVGAYCDFAQHTGMRLTFFVTPKYRSWTENIPKLGPLVASGRIQLGNHTWSHPDLTKLSTSQIQDELGRTGDFIQHNYGVDARPYYRPPYGYHDDHVHAAASALGYSKPVLWYGTLSDSGLITEQQVMSFANTWMLPQHIVIGHANFTPVTHVFDQIRDLIHSRGLQPITLDDLFLRG